VSWSDSAAELAGAAFAAFGEPALYFPAGAPPDAPGQAITVQRREGQQAYDFNGGRIATAGVVFEVRAAEVSSPTEGAILQLQDGTRRRVQGAPARDAEGTVWLLDTVRVS
jgi:hypothetical protein